MKLLQKYLIQQFFPVFFVALLFFVLMLELGDLFTNLWKYISNDVSALAILKVLWLYIPKCISYSMPMSILFASSYTMGSMYARNELTSIFASGYPLYLLIIPLLVAGLFMSFGMFFFEDRVVIHTQAEKNNLNRVLLKTQISLSNTNVVILSDDGKIVYTADYYQDAEKRLYSVLVVIRDTEGNPEYIIQAPKMKWDGSQWIPETFCVYDVRDMTNVTIEATLPFELTEPPETFRRNTTSVDELEASEARSYLQNLRKAGLPFAEQMSNYYKRYSFPFTIFIVLFFSISLGGRFKKNILLMSLLLSLSIAVLYYVLQMVSMLFAKWEYISPLIGAWFPVLFFIVASIIILRYART